MNFKLVLLVLFPSIVCADVFNVSANAVVRVIDPVTGSMGGGVYVAPSTVLTALHIIGEAKEVLVITRIGQKFEATVMETDPQNDLARLLVAKALPHPVAKINFSSLSLGQDVFSIGHPNGLGWSLARGYVMFEGERRVVVEEGLPATVIQVDLAIFPGASGGPLFNLDGEVLGIAKGAIPGTEIAYFVPATSFCKKVLKCQKK